MNRFCSECGGLVDQTTGVCTKCSKQIVFTDKKVNRTGNNRLKTKVTIVLIVIALAFIIFGGLYFFTLFSSKQTNYTKSITTYNHITNGVSTTTKKYDDRGNVIKSIYKSDNSYWVDKTTYDTNNNITNQTRYDKDGNVVVSRDYENEYDDNNNLISFKHYYNGEFGYSMNYEFDKNGNAIIGRTTDGRGDTREYKYEYDSNGNMICEEYYLDNELCTHRYDYDKNNKLIEIRDYDSKNNLKNKVVIEYDKKGREISRLYYSSDGRKYAYSETEYFKD